MGDQSIINTAIRYPYFYPLISGAKSQNDLFRIEKMTGNFAFTSPFSVGTPRNSSICSSVSWCSSKSSGVKLKGLKGKFLNLVKTKVLLGYLDIFAMSTWWVLSTRNLARLQRKKVTLGRTGVPAKKITGFFCGAPWSTKLVCDHMAQDRWYVRREIWDDMDAMWNSWIQVLGTICWNMICDAVCVWEMRFMLQDTAKTRLWYELHRVMNMFIHQNSHLKCHETWDHLVWDAILIWCTNVRATNTCLIQHTYVDTMSRHRMFTLCLYAKIMSYTHVTHVAYGFIMFSIKNRYIWCLHPRSHQLFAGYIRGMALLTELPLQTTTSTCQVLLGSRESCL